MNRHRGFTLIELLVVIVIIAVLVALLLPVVSLVRFKARAVDTSLRLEAALHALVEHGGQKNSAAFALMRDADLDGVKLWAVERGDRMVSALDNAPEPETDAALLARAGVVTNAPLDYTADHTFAFPWGRERDLDGDGLFGEPGEEPDPRHLGQLSTARSTELMVLSGIAPDPSAYRDDRSPERRWNDAWGNPLVLAYGVYQDRAQAITGEHVDPDGKTSAYATNSMLQAREAYGFTRAVYLSAAAAGPRFTRDPDFATTLQAVWDQAIAVCGSDDAGDPLWTAGGFTDPPWEGVRLGKADRRRSFLAAPVELK